MEFLYEFVTRKHRILTLMCIACGIGFLYLFIVPLNVYNQPQAASTRRQLDDEVSNLQRKYGIVQGSYASNQKKEKMKIIRILYWNPRKPGGTIHARGCPKGCIFTKNKTEMSVDEFDAILFSYRGLSEYGLPSKRAHRQIYIFHEAEAPVHIEDRLDLFDGFFNFTFALRRDADNTFEYFKKIKHYDKRIEDYLSTHNMALGKTKMAAWVVSHCYSSSGREALAKELGKFIDVTIFGACGIPCIGDLTRKRDKRCFEIIAKSYKFYLSFENALCRDYLTEKFPVPLREFLIPIVYGSGNYSSLAPPHSFIDARAFNTVEDLANYLIYLDKNDTAYNEYFRWKKDYRLIIEDSWCNLCKKLHAHKTKVYTNLTDWFSTQANCIIPKSNSTFYLLQPQESSEEELNENSTSINTNIQPKLDTSDSTLSHLQNPTINETSIKFIPSSTIISVSQNLSNSSNPHTTNSTISQA